MDFKLPQKYRLELKELRPCGPRGRPLGPISFDVRAGELVAIFGPTGSGKTALLRAMAGLDRAAGGTMLLEGLDVTLLPARRRMLAFAFQTPALYPHLRVDQNISLALEAQDVAENARVRRTDELLESFDLFALRALKPAQLTDDERHLAGLARTLVRDSQAFLLDEPFGAIEGERRATMRRRLLNIHRSLRATTIYATRNADDVLDIADRVIVLNEGGVDAQGVPSEVLARDRAQSVTS